MKLKTYLKENKKSILIFCSLLCFIFFYSYSVSLIFSNVHSTDEVQIATNETPVEKSANEISAEKRNKLLDNQNHQDKEQTVSNTDPLSDSNSQPQESNPQTIQDQIKSSKSIAELRAALQILGDKYGLIFKTSPHTITHSSWDGLKESDLEQAKLYASAFEEEWSKNTPAFVKKSGLKEIYIVKNIVVAGQSRAAVPANGQILAYSIEYGNSAYAQRVVHHEFFHIVDHNRFGDFYASDPQWVAYNSSSFEYGDGGASAYSDPNYSNTEHPQNGFVTGYATYGEEEDRAETYMYMMEGPLLQKIKSWKNTDSALKSKYEYIKQLMKSYDSSINDSYFSFTY